MTDFTNTVGNVSSFAVRNLKILSHVTKNALSIVSNFCDKISGSLSLLLLNYYHASEIRLICKNRYSEWIYLKGYYTPKTKGL